MDNPAAAAASAGGAPDAREFGAGRVFASDARMTLALLNEARHMVLRRYLGLSREQANLVTAAFMLAGADAAYVTVRRVVHEPWGVSRADLGLAGIVMREAVYGVAGPKARQVPLFGILVVGALVGNRAVPTVRRALHAARLAEHRIRERRLRMYNLARGARR